MAESPSLDFAALLAPIPGPNPAGLPVPFEIREKLGKDRKEINDPSLPAEDQKKADWNAVERVATETLTRTSKDLLVAARLTEALAKRHRFAGLKAGLRLLRELVENCWDRLYPAIEDGDLEVRAGPFNWLDDPDSGARFPTTIRLVPLVGNDTENYSWLDWASDEKGRSPASREDFEKTALATSQKDCEETFQDLNEALQECNQLAQLLHTKIGPAAPGMTGMRKAIEDCRVLLKQILDRRPAAASKNDIPLGGPQSSAVPAVPKQVTSRAEAYRLLSEAARLLQELEPHSPIPYLVQRAVELGALPFPQLIKELVRDTNVLTALNRELGIKDKEPPPQPKK